MLLVSVLHVYHVLRQGLLALVRANIGLGKATRAQSCVSHCSTVPGVLSHLTQLLC